MCLPDFIEFKQVSKFRPMTGYRNWNNPRETLNLKAQNFDYIWSSPIDGPNKVEDKDSGLYAYNYNYNNNYNLYNYIGGIIKQWGKVAIHKDGQRSEYAKVSLLFTIRDSDAKGPDEFIKWIKEVFNPYVKEIAKKYKCKTQHWQDFIEEMKAKKLKSK